MTKKRAVVTGASSGIGEATVRRLAALGWEVTGVARRAERLAALAADLEGAGTPVRTIAADLTKADDVARFADEVAAGGPLHALVNNAGGAFDLASVESADPDAWRAMYEINVIAVQQVTSRMLPLLRTATRDGGYASIVTVTSTASFTPYEGGAGYNAAKAGARMVTAVLRLELAGEPIRVIDVAPGLVKTDEFSLKRFGGDRAKAEAVYAGVEDPLTAEDVALVIADALELPGHVNLDTITVRPVAQAAQHKLIRAPLAPKA